MIVDSPLKDPSGFGRLYNVKQFLCLFLAFLVVYSPLSATVYPSTSDAFLQKTAQLVTMGNVTSITPPGRPAHTYTYDPGNQVSGYTAPDLGAGPTTTNYAYDLEGHPTQITRPDGQTLTFDYNAGGQISTVTTPSGTYNYTYDPAGRLSALSESGGITLTYVHDGTLPLSTTWTGPISGDISRTYDNNFRVVSQSVNGANTINFTYDNDGLLTKVGDLNLTRDAENGLLSATELGTVSDTWTYNTFGEPTIYTAKTSGADAYSVTYTRDAMGRITQKNETIGATSHLFVYTYDISGRLTTVQKDGTTVATYTYDANGNRQTNAVSGVTTNGTYDAQDRLLTYGGNTYTYNENGELKTKANVSGTTTYTYDILGNLRKFILPDGTQIDYVIDGQDRRVGKKVNGILTQGFLYNGRLDIAAELDGGGNIVSRFVYVSKNNVPDYMVRGGITYRIVTDHLGSPRLVVNVADGSVIQRIDYDEWGNIITDTNPGFIPFTFAGGIRDFHSNLVRFGARDFDPETGRWTSKDPARFVGGDFNLYGYAFNDPINSADPDGENAAILGGAAIIAAVFIVAILAAMNSPAGLALRNNIEDMVDAMSDILRAEEVAENPPSGEVADSQTAENKQCKEKRVKSKTLRDKWKEAEGQDWPKDPNDPTRNQDVSHKKPLADGGTNDIGNIEPKPHDEHMREHQENGDFSRWGKRRNL
jgi:RHS repeat-associated protein